LSSNASPGTVPTALYAPLAGGARKLRIAALVDREIVPAWIAETLAAIAASEATSLVAVVVVTAPPPAPLPWTARAFLALDARLAGGARVATAPQPFAARVPDVPVLRAAGTEREGRLDLGAEALATLGTLDADLMIGFGLPPASKALAAASRRGAWFFERRATDAQSCGLRFIDPLWRGDVLTPSGVVVHVDDARVPERLGVSWNATAMLSFSRNRAYQLLRIPAELVRVLRRLAQGRPIERQALEDSAPPGPAAWLGFALRLVGRAARRHLPRLGKVETWVLGVRRGATPLDPERAGGTDFHVISAPPGLIWADPFAVHDAGRDYVFVEECPPDGRGRIAVFELGQSFEVSPSRVVLDPPWHLSYPIVFEWKGERWLMTESSEAGTLTLHRSIEFPHRWEPVRNLIEGRTVVDATLHFDGERWYLFAAVSESPFGYDQRIWCDLFAFWASEPSGPWHPHALNPLLSDVRRARPAGDFFMHDGRLIRPAQDCSTDYGHAIVFHEVLKLDPEHYEERVIGRLDPDWAPGLRGCHTYARSGNLEVVDGKLLVPRRAAVRHKDPADGA
jgi:hypothetical protein